MSRRRSRGKAQPFGTSKHRAARVQRFQARNPASGKVPCPQCNRARSACVCHLTPERIQEIDRGRDA